MATPSTLERLTTSTAGVHASSLARQTAFLAFCLPWLLLLAWLASVAWFLCDDAFISFRYARNLLDGHGLVFNPGERVEGYSNFLWVLELALIWALVGLRPEHAAPWLSVACTVGTVAAMLWWIARIPGVRHRRMVAWIALGLVCSSATFAVWTSAGGLETRQFTFFVVLAIVCLTVHGSRCWGLILVSLSLAAASYTRPEGPLIAACCFAWFIGQRILTSKRLRLEPTEVFSLIAPFVVLVLAHVLFRHAYYGEWLPNTYYAKHVRPWYESGFRYLWAAALETGLYFLWPLALLALRETWRERRDLCYALPLLCIGLHAAYLFRIGGDHFEYRPLDFYWPLLAVPAATSIVGLGSAISTNLSRVHWNLPAWTRPRPSVCAVALFVPALVYSSALQGAILFGVTVERSRTLLALPAMPILVAISNDLRSRMGPQYVALRLADHRFFADGRLQLWRDYDRMQRGVIPTDALTASGTIGIPFYYLPDLRVVDTAGLTDATVARHPVERPNEERVIAHDRSPPPGYLQERGVNFQVHPPATSAVQALSRAQYTVLVGLDLWMPFDSEDHDWVVERFGTRNLLQR